MQEADLCLLLSKPHLSSIAATTPGAMPSRPDKPPIVSADARRLQTNMSDLMPIHVLSHTPDVIATVKIFLNSSVPPNFGQLQGYTP